MASCIAFLLIGAFAGWIASQIVKGEGFGLGGNLVLGILGAFIGGYIFQVLGITWGGFIGTLGTATLGAVVFLGAVQLIKQI